MLATAQSAEHNHLGAYPAGMDGSIKSALERRTISPTMAVENNDDALMSRCARAICRRWRVVRPVPDSAVSYYLRTTGNRASSEDLVQDVFLRMLKYRKTTGRAAAFRHGCTTSPARAARLPAQAARRSGMDDAYAAPFIQDDAAEAPSSGFGSSGALLQLPEDKREVLC